MQIPSLIVVDDEADMGRLVCDVAETAGFVANHFINSRDFIEQFIDTVDVIVLDLRMPDIDGVELIRFLAEKHTSAAIILLSGVDAVILHSAKELAEAHQLKLLGTLQKPFSARELLKLLANTTIAQDVELLEQQDYQHEQIELAELQTALMQQQFVPFFQPQVCLKNRHLLGFEALTRWHHPEKGLIAPQHFIPLLEKHGLIHDLTWTILEQTAQIWGEAGFTYSLSVNMPVSIFKLLDLPERLDRIILRYGLDPSQLMLEITESAVMEELTKSLETLTRLRMHGFQLSIDDFGTGYSSLVQLYRAPFSELKVDQTFVTKMEKDPEALAIVDTTIMLAHRLNMKVVAEGVETLEIMNHLIGLNADSIQGYYIAKPMPSDAIKTWIKTNNYL